MMDPPYQAQPHRNKPGPRSGTEFHLPQLARPGRGPRQLEDSQFAPSLATEPVMSPGSLVDHYIPEPKMPNGHAGGLPGNFARPQPYSNNARFHDPPRLPPPGRQMVVDPRAAPYKPYVDAPPHNGYSGPRPGQMNQVPPAMRNFPPRQRSPPPDKMGPNHSFPDLQHTRPPRSLTSPPESAMVSMHIGPRQNMGTGRPHTSGTTTGYSSASSDRRFQHDQAVDATSRDASRQMRPGPQHPFAGPPPGSMPRPTPTEPKQWPIPGQHAPPELVREPRLQHPMQYRPQLAPEPRSDFGAEAPSRQQSPDQYMMQNPADQYKMKNPADQYMKSSDNQYMKMKSPDNPHAMKSSNMQYMMKSSNTNMDEYMPNFEASAQDEPLKDPLGIPLDAAPGIARSNPATPKLHLNKSQPNLRATSDEHSALRYTDASQASRMPGAMPPQGQRAASPDIYLGRSIASGGPQGQPIYSPQDPPRISMAESAWSDPGVRHDPMSNPLDRPPPQGQREPPPGRTRPPLDIRFAQGSGPGTGPIPHPMLVRSPLSQNGSYISSHVRQRERDPKRAVGQDVKDDKPEPPVTLAILEGLRFHCRNNLNDNKSYLALAKRLIEASTSLVDENGQVDARTRAKNRERYLSEAYKTIKKLVQRSDPESTFFMADAYGDGSLGLEVDHKEAFSLYQQAAKLNHPVAAYRTAVCYEVGGDWTKKDATKAMQYYHLAAKLGNVSAMYKIGMILLKGLLWQQQNIAEGIKWLKRASERADEDNPHAVYELAVLHEFPLRNSSMTADQVYALQLYQEAARLGYRVAQTRLGKAFEHGQLGCPIDDRSSIHWYTKAAAQEDAEAELALAAWYLTGSRNILETDETEAYLWARKAAIQEYPKSEFAMGFFSEVGIGCPTNLEDAKRWYGRAASHNYLKAQEALENLRKGDRRQRRQQYSRSGRHEECTVM